MIKGSGKLNKETYESLLKQGISAEDIRKGEKNRKLRWVAFPMECWVGVLRDEEDDEE